MKADIHPSDYRLVVFQDLNDGTSFLIKSTARTKETVKHSDGRTYPLVKLHITSASHPFYTGKEKVIDVEGRIDKFKSRKQAAAEAQKQLQAKSLKTLKRSADKAKEARKGRPKPSKSPAGKAGKNETGARADAGKASGDGET